MKKMIVLAFVMVFSVSFFAGCDNSSPKAGKSKSDTCGKLYDKMNSCVKEMLGDKTDGNPIGNKKDFVKKCKKEKNLNEAAKCMNKKDCDDFISCLRSIDDDGLFDDDEVNTTRVKRDYSDTKTLKTFGEMNVHDDD